MQAEKRSQPRRSEVYAFLRKAILRGDFAPGVRIVESALAKQKGVSRTPIREALYELTKEKLVVIDLNRGFSVAPLSASQVRELYPILWTLECLALDQTGPFAFSAVDGLRKLNKELRSAKTAAKAIAIDTQWHQRLLADCPNKSLSALIEQTRSSLERYERFYASDKKLLAISSEQHDEIAAALSKRDLVAAKEKLTDNWRFGMEVLLRSIGETVNG